MMHLAATLPWPKVKALADAGAVALLPVGSTEAHGPHLPLNVDVVLAEEVCRRASALLDAVVDTVCFPAVCYSLTDFAAPFAGTVSVPADAARASLEAVFTGILRGGFGAVCAVNHHVEPAHFRVVHDAAKAAAAATGKKVLVPDHRRAPTGPALGHEFMHGGSHAGHYETSLMLAAAPQLVGEVVRSLPTLEVDLPARIKAGARNFLEVGGADAYLGAPSQATAAEGERLFALLAALTADTIRAR